MSKALRASRVMGLFALVLGAMAFGATAAQAEVGAQWKVAGAAVTTALKAQVQVTEIETLKATGVKEGILLSTSGGSKVEILCTSMKFVDALLTELGGATGKIHFEGCVTKLNEKPAASTCKPHSPGAAEGLIETNTLDGLIKLHTTGTGSKVDLFELLPTKVGGNTPPFVTLILGAEGETKNECAIGEKFDVTGKAFLKEGNEEGLVEKVTHLFEEGPLKELLFGGNTAIIDGSATAALVAPHNNMTWSGIAS